MGQERKLVEVAKRALTFYALSLDDELKNKSRFAPIKDVLVYEKSLSEEALKKLESLEASTDALYPSSKKLGNGDVLAFTDDVQCEPITRAGAGGVGAPGPKNFTGHTAKARAYIMEQFISGTKKLLLRDIAVSTGVHPSIVWKVALRLIKNNPDEFEYYRAMKSEGKVKGIRLRIDKLDEMTAKKVLFRRNDARRV